MMPTYNTPLTLALLVSEWLCNSSTKKIIYVMGMSRGIDIIIQGIIWSTQGPVSQGLW